MNLQFTFGEFIVDMYEEDRGYNPSSVDNVISYDQYYSIAEERASLLTQIGIKTIDLSDEIIKRVCIAASGGATGVHKRCCVLSSNTITICCANTVFNLTLPDLALRWKTKSDDATCFEIYERDEGYIVHGELQISKLDDKGNILWQFTGNDIFTTPTGRNAFRIENDIIYATNWDNVVFKLNADTGELLE